MCQFVLQQEALDALHALLSVVPDQGSTSLEDRREQGQVLILRLGRGPGLLEVLCVVFQDALRPSTDSVLMLA